nr:MAG TPA_asm: hypothetical protein [Caudoviricetes sp.]
MVENHIYRQLHHFFLKSGVFRWLCIVDECVDPYKPGTML